MYCTKCHAQLADDARFCTSCGSPVEPEMRQAASAACPKCGNTELAPDAAFCPKCGYRLTGGTNVNYYPALGQRWCKNCKSAVPYGGAECPICHSRELTNKPDIWMGIVALALSFFFGFGIVFAILGIISASKTKYSTLKILCIISFVVCGIWSIIWIGNIIG